MCVWFFGRRDCALMLLLLHVTITEESECSNRKKRASIPVVFCTLDTVVFNILLNAFVNPINQPVIWVGSVFIWSKQRLTFVLEWHFLAVLSESKADAVAVTQPCLWPVMFSPGLQSFTMAPSRQDDREPWAEKIGSFPLLICQLSVCQRRTASVR